jgi:cysteinyl-tRNA synthetase
MVREANAQADAGKLRKDDAAPLLAALGKFDEIFAVLTDDDAPKVQRVREWARREGKLEAEAAPAGLSDAEVDALIAERDQARRARDFKKSDAIRDQLAAAGILLEDTKDGVRWKRK